MSRAMNILYVEDDLRDVDLTLRTLKEVAPHFHIETAATRRAAIERLNSQEKQFNLVLTDMHLPDGDGISLVSYIREKNLPFPVVVITGAGDEETAVSALKAGADDYVVKRGDYIDRLPLTLEDALHRFRTQTSRRSGPLNVLYAERNKMDADLTRDHFLHYAPYIHLEVVTTGAEVLNRVQQPDGHSHGIDRYDVILLDYRLPGLSGLEVLKELRQTRGLEIPTVLITGQGDEDVALQAIKLGATSYLVKNPGYLYRLPSELENAHYRAELIRQQLALQQALLEVGRLKDQLQAENVYLREEVRRSHEFGEGIGQSEPFKIALRQAEQVAPTDTTVLITGETGTGKELLAHTIHNFSGRVDRPLVKVNCATLPLSLIESELFGHEKGAFTGASALRSGRFELADRATIFLDEIGELSLELQAKLLRVLQEGEFERLGSSRTIKVDVRVIAATNRDLEEEMRGGRFRADLYYRLNVFPIRMPSLRERGEDIRMLAKFFVERMSQKIGKRIEAISEEALEAMEQYEWPGNVRELKNVIERAVIITIGNKLQLPEILENCPKAEPLVERVPKPNAARAPASLEEIQRQHIIQALDQTYWRVEGPQGAAAILGMNPGTLRSRMKRFGIRKPTPKE